jgi:hypothetical protein
VRGFAAALRDAGTIVHTPDLFDGRGVAHELGFPMALVERARAEVALLPADLVYVGFSLGALPGACSRSWATTGRRGR